MNIWRYTMNLNENLPRIIKSLNKPIKDIAEEIGISPNTLSNIKNGKVEPNGETLNKILSYLKANGISEEEINKEQPLIQNIRIRTNKELSGIEKSLLKDDLSDFAKLLAESDRSIQNAFNYFDYCDEPIENGDLDTLWDRRKRILKAVKANEDLFKTVYNFYFADTVVLQHKETTVKIDLKRLLDMLGIRVFFKCLRTEKITSFSTVMKTENDNSIILINTNVCKTMEYYFYEICKQFYFIFKVSQDYNHNSKDIILPENETILKRADNFADNFLLNIDALNKYLEIHFNNKVCDFDYIINSIKRYFEVSYKLAIKQLLKSNFEYTKYLKDYETSEQFYFECLKRSEVEYQSKTVYIDDEPFPLSVDFKPYDAARLIYSPELNG